MQGKRVSELIISLAEVAGSSSVYIFTPSVVYALCCEGRLHPSFIGGASEAR